jgi:hypothetical protein
MSDTISLNAPHLEVQGAGNPDFDGVYTRCDESWNEAPQWKHTQAAYWIFWSGGGWVIGDENRVGGRQMHYTNYSASKDAIKEAVLASNYEELYRIEELVTPIPRTPWDVYITGSELPKFQGGVGAAPTVEDE